MDWTHNLDNNTNIPYINMFKEKYKNCNMFISGNLRLKSNAYLLNEC